MLESWPGRVASTFISDPLHLFLQCRAAAKRFWIENLYPHCCTPAFFWIRATESRQPACQYFGSQRETIAFVSGIHSPKGRMVPGGVVNNTAGSDDGSP